MELYFPPNVQVSPSFNSSYDCQFEWNQNSCNIVFVQTATYLKMTIKPTGTWSTNMPNGFPYQYRTWIYLRNILFPTTSTTKTVYPIYCTLYKSDVVNPVAYRKGYFISANPR